MRDKFDVEFTTGLTAKKSPDFVDVIQKTVAGVSEQDLIERNTIGQVKDSEDEREEQPDTTEQSEL